MTLVAFGLGLLLAVAGPSRSAVARQAPRFYSQILRGVVAGGAALAPAPRS